MGRKSVVVGSFRKGPFNQPISDEETQSRRSVESRMVQDYKSVKSNYKSRSVADFDAVSTGSNLTAKRRTSRRPATAIKKEFEKIRQQYAQNAQDFEGITYTDENYRMSWLELAKSFIYERTNIRVNKFLKTITKTKVQSELELKRKIERRIYAAKDYKLFNIFGKDLGRRLKTYVGAVLDSYHQEEEHEENNDNRGKTVSFGVSFSKVSQKEKNAKQHQQQIWQNDDPDFFLRLKTLQRNHTEAAKKLLLLNYNSRDEQKQLIHFVISYYDILASENERKALQQLLNSDVRNQLYQRDFLKDKQRQKKLRLVQLASPKRTLSKKFQNLGMAHGGSNKNLEQTATSWVQMQKSTISMLQSSIGDLKQANKIQNDEWARIKNRLSQTRHTSDIAGRVKLKFSRESPTKMISARLPRAPSAVPAIDQNPALNSFFEKFELASDETPKAKKQQTATIKVARLLNKAPSMPQLKRKRSVDLIKQPQNGPYQKKLTEYMDKRQKKIGITTPLEQEIFKLDQILDPSIIHQEQPGAVHSAFTFTENSSQLPQNKTIPVKKIENYKVSKAIMMYLQTQPVLKQPYRK